ERVHAVSFRARRIQGEPARPRLRRAPCTEAQRRSVPRLSRHGSTEREIGMKGLIIACTASLVLCGCRNDARPADDQTTGSIDSAAWEQARTLPAGVAEALDSGNAAFRNREYAAARAHYLRAVQLGPDQSAAWFGLSMVERQLGNIPAADSAMDRVRALAPGASLVHPDTAATRDSLPSG